MRTSILLLRIILSVPLQAQTSFVPIGGTWTYTQHYVGGPDTNLFVIQCIGDTVIQGRTCSHLAFTEGWNDCMPFLPALTRQGDSILAFQPMQQAFNTLYVFGQAPGFSWKTPVEGTDTLTWTVTDTGHVVINGVVLLQQSVTAVAVGPGYSAALTSGTIIDRLGDLGYLFPWIGGTCDMENNYPLRCYQDSDISWLNPQFPQCELSTSIDETEGADRMTITPTMLERGGAVQITLGRSMVGNSILKIWDLTGRLLATKPVTGMSMTYTAARSGLVLITLRMDGALLAAQRVVVR